MERLQNSDIGTLLVRLAIGIVFVHAGWLKLQDVGMVAGFFSSMGIPAFFAYVVSYAEFLGGIALILGLGVRYVGIVLSVIMLVAIAKVHYTNGYGLQNNGYEYVLLLLLGSLGIVALGAGKYSIDGWLAKKAAAKAQQPAA